MKNRLVELINVIQLNFLIIRSWTARTSLNLIVFAIISVFAKGTLLAVVSVANAPKVKVHCNPWKMMRRSSVIYLAL